MPAHSDHGRHPSGSRKRWAHHDDRFPIDPDLALDDPGAPSLVHRPVPHVHRARQRSVVGAIAAGGFLGALGRYELELAWPATPGHVPWATLVVNTTGAFVLGIVLTVLLERPAWARRFRPFLCIGVVGAWTTMSSFAVEVDVLLRRGAVLVAVAYLSATVVLGVWAGWVGAVLGRRLDPKRALWTWR